VDEFVLGQGTGSILVLASVVEGETGTSRPDSTLAGVVAVWVLHASFLSSLSLLVTES